MHRRHLHCFPLPGSPLAMGVAMLVAVGAAVAPPPRTPTGEAATAVASVHPQATGPGVRRVNWFMPAGGVRSVDNVTMVEWATKHRGSMTGLFPCCGCWSADPHTGKPTNS